VRVDPEDITVIPEPVLFPTLSRHGFPGFAYLAIADFPHCGTGREAAEGSVLDPEATLSSAR
jgi:hypothetical protein